MCALFCLFTIRIVALLWRFFWSTERISWTEPITVSRDSVPYWQKLLLRDGFYKVDKNSSGDEIANVNFYAVRPEANRIRWNNAK